MKLSVALCTYNGERFLPEQLASVLAQQRQPDEVVICDDKSSDGTLALVRRFAHSAPFPVRIEANAARLGSTRNFAQAIALCTGEAIALADQDDAWRPEKLATLENALLRCTDAAYAFSDAEIVDANLQPLGYRLWDALRFGIAERRRFADGHAFALLLRRYRVTGATMIFRAEYRDRILPIPEGWVHDAWIALILSALAPCVLVEQPLLDYRQHGSQQHGARMRSLAGQFRSACELTRRDCEAVVARYQQAGERLSRIPNVATERMQLLGEKIDHHRRRAEMRGTWRLSSHFARGCPSSILALGQGWKTIAQDLLLR